MVRVHRDIGGLRLEARIRATCVSAAVRTFMAHELWKIYELLHFACEDRPITFVSIENYKDNLEKIMRVARTAVLSVPCDDKKIPQILVKRFRDVLNAFGLNPGWFGHEMPNLAWESAWWQNLVEIPTRSFDEIIDLYQQCRDRLVCSKCRCP